MSAQPLAKYAFLAWLRRGASVELTDADPLSGPLPRRRALLAATVTVASSGGPSSGTDDVSTKVELYGPGDVTGVDPRHVVRTDPRNLTQNFEPNFLAAIEFEDPGFPWAYTPAAPTPSTSAQRDRLRPWLALIVLDDDEFNRPERAPDPLPVIRIKDTGMLPDLDESWAWAHVQVGGGLTGDLGTIVLREPGRVTSRIVCPRQLRPTTDYTAFLVPAFDVGVAAGLGNDPPAGLQAKPAWRGSAQNVDLPVYHSFEFRTSTLGDFESLVRKLKPRRLPKEVGIRPLDVSQPGWGMPSAGSPLGLSGALRSLETQETPWDTAAKAPFQAKLQQSLNKGTVTLDGPADPVVVPPIYGRWHAAVTSVDRLQTGWLNELNLDPRPRSMAGYGTRVVLAQRDQLLAGAWSQVDRILEANRLLRNGQLAREVSALVHEKHLEAAPADVSLAMTSAMHKRLLASPQTVHSTVDRSRLPVTALAPSFRRTARPLGPIGRRGAATGAGREGFVRLLNAGRLTPFPPAGRPISLEDVADSYYPSWIPIWLRPYLRHAVWFLLLLAVLVGLLLLVVGLALGWGAVALVVAAVAAGALVVVAGVFRALSPRFETARRLRVDALTPDVFASAPPAPDFRVPEPRGETPTTPPEEPPQAGRDSPEARRFREASIQLAGVLQTEPARIAQLEPVEIAPLATEIVAKLDPERTVPARITGLVDIAAVDIVDWDNRGDALDPIMAAPEFPQPMYEPLRDISQDLLLPGLEDVSPDTLGLMEENHAFIEAYMVGLNHAMAQQLLLENFPTDQRGSYFRQFWDVRGYVPTAADPTDRDALRERLNDIPKVHDWPKTRPLGDNENRPEQVEDNLVLLVRGELLQRYPNAIIYAAEAVLEDGRRVPGAKELYPLYAAKLLPDVTLLGFNVDEPTARGSREAGKPQGWFFVFQQNPGEPRFGLEPAPDPYAVPAVDQWNELSWANFAPDQNALEQLTYLPAATPPQGVSIVEGPDNPGDAQNAWGKDAAQTAFILLNRPARIAIHAELMLPAA